MTEAKYLTGPEAAGRRLHELALDLVIGADVPYERAFQEVLNDPCNNPLKVVYAGGTLAENRAPRRYSETETRRAGVELDRLAKRFIADHPGRTYHEALHEILSDPDNAELKRAYAAS